MYFSSLYFKGCCSFLTSPLHCATWSTIHWKEQTPPLLNLLHTVSYEARFSVTRRPVTTMQEQVKSDDGCVGTGAGVTFSPTEATATQFLSRQPDRTSSWNRINQHPVLIAKRWVLTLLISNKEF